MSEEAIRCEVDQLVAILREEAIYKTVIAIGTFPRKGHTGLLEEQGDLVNQIRNRTVDLIPTIDVFRILWTQIVFLLSSTDLDYIQSKIQELLTIMKNELIEVRAIIVPPQSLFSLEKLDSIFGEISTKRNFGNEYSDFAIRLIDGALYEAR